MGASQSGTDFVYDVLVVGAGAAGLMTAIMSRRAGLRVLVCDAKAKIGAKILMSGGTRCNVTNLQVSERDYASEHLREVSHVLRAFPSQQAIKFFEELGIEFVMEDGGKFFPSTHSGKTILDALLKEVNQLGVALHAPRKITKARFIKECFDVAGEDFHYLAKTVVLCTGGLSYPSTGSDGVGYRIAKSFGHKLIPMSAALTPLRSDDALWTSLSGVSLPCRLTLRGEGKKLVAYESPLLFTHFGFSGTAVLNISRYWGRMREVQKVEIVANFFPEAQDGWLEENLLNAVKEHPQRSIKRFLSEWFAERFIEVFLKKINISEKTVLNQLKREDRQRLVKSCVEFPLPVKDVFGYAKAEVTAGGVDLAEVNPKTMESKLQPGLFFAGEILDVDGRIGGFNFQWAWSSGFVAGQGIARRIL